MQDGSSFFFYALVCPVNMWVSKTKVSETLLLLEGGVPEGEVVGKINIDTQSVVKPTTPPVGHPSFLKEGSQIVLFSFNIFLDITLSILHQ